MIEIETFTDKFITCPICKCVYDDPATLQCGHTYCRQCLTGLIQCRPDSIRDKVLPCSMRCNGTNVPNPEQPVETWPSQIKPSFIIKSLVEEFERVTVTDCSRCRSTDIKMAAVKFCSTCHQSLCEGCVTCHKKDLPTRHHTLTELPIGNQDQYVRCEDHRDELVKLICNDCNKAICSTCWSKTHEQCSVILMEAKLEQIKEIVFDQKSEIEKEIQTHMINMARYQTKVDELDNMKRVTQSIIRCTFQNVIDLIKVKESSLLFKLDDVIEKEIQIVQENIESEAMNIQIYQQRSHVIEQALKKGSLTDKYNKYQSYLSSETSLGTTENKQSSHRNVKDVMHSLSNDQLAKSIDNFNFGTIEVKYETQTDGSELFQSPVLDGIVVCTMSSDKDSPSLRDITALVVDGIPTIVVTDHNNSCVKSFYNRDNQLCHSKLLLDKEPWGITQWKENHVMVAVPFFRQIVTAEVTPDLMLRSTITTNRKYNSLAVIDESSMAAGSGYSSCVDILNMEGDVLTSVSTSDTMQMFCSPWYLSVNNMGDVLVSDWRKRSVTCLTSDGDVVWQYAPTGDQALKGPEGIEFTTEGVLVVDRDRVIQLTESGQYVRDVITAQDGVSNPLGIYVDKNNSLCVCSSSRVSHFKFADK